MYVNGVPFLTTISKQIMFRTTDWLRGTDAKAYRSAIEQVMRLYIKRGFYIRRLHCDNAFKQAIELIQKDYPKVDDNVTSAQEHQPDAEHNNRVIQERVRKIILRLMTMLLVLKNISQMLSITKE